MDNRKKLGDSKQKYSTGQSRATLKRKKKLAPKSDGAQFESAADHDSSMESTSKQKKLKKERANIDEPLGKNQNSAKRKTDQTFESSNGAIIGLDIPDVSIEAALSEEEFVNIDYRLKSKGLLSHLISPTSIPVFYKDFFDGKQPLHCPRFESSVNQFRTMLLSKKKIEKLFEQHILHYNVDIEIYKYESRKANVLEKNVVNEGIMTVEVSPRDVWQRFSDGFTFKLSCPQKFNDNIWKILSLLELEFGCPVTCAALLNPSGYSRSSAMIEAVDSFVIQVEGSSRWIIFQCNKGDELPLESQELLDHSSLLPTSEASEASGSYMDLVLKAGEKLFIPRGWICYHECAPSAAGQNPSLVLTFGIGTGNNSIRHLVDMVLPQATAAVASATIELRRNLPGDFLASHGVANSEEDEDNRRNHFQTKFKRYLASIAAEAVDMIDAAADQMAKSFLAARLPPPLTEAEDAQSSAGAPNAIIYPYTVLRMVRPGVARAIVEDGMVVLYHCMDNARDQFGLPLNPLEFELDDGPAIEGLLNAYPEGIAVSDLTHPSEEMDDKVEVAKSLFKEGFLIIVDEASKQVNSDDEQNDDDDNPF